MYEGGKWGLFIMYNIEFFIKLRVIENLFYYLFVL